MTGSPVVVDVEDEEEDQVLHELHHVEVFHEEISQAELHHESSLFCQLPDQGSGSVEVVAAGVDEEAAEASG